MLPHGMSTQISQPFIRNSKKNRRDRQRGQTVGEFGILLTGVLILGIVAGVYYFFSSQSQCERDGLTDAECAAAADAAFPYADGEACFTLQDSVQQTTCQNHNDCLQLPGVPRGTYNSDKNVEIVVIEAGVTHYLFENTSTIDGCYEVGIDGANVSWQSNSSGQHCEEIRYLQLWSIPLCKTE